MADEDKADEGKTAEDQADEAKGVNGLKASPNLERVVATWL